MFKIPRLRELKLFEHIQKINVKYSTASAIVQKKEKINIPPRIERGPTDILRALAATIKPDPTAAHYKYHDDPYLIPKSNMGKRTFAMAQEAGRKAAVWIRQQHPDLFEQTLADPPIKSFLPQRVFNENSEVDEAILQEVINNVQVDDAVTVYELLEKKNVEISRETRQALLELLCFFNSEDALDEKFIEERWFTQDNKSREKQRKTWRDNALAERLFHTIEPPNSASYSALIQGMLKYKQVDAAWKLYEESQQKRIILTTEVYNSFIRVANFLKEANDLRWKFVEEMLTRMQKENLRPNLGTLNAVLESISYLIGSRQAKDYILSTLAEFKNIGIEPSLASWYYVLKTLCKDRGPKSAVLYDIMNYLNNQELKICDPNDTYFFVTAMDVCRNHLQDVNLAYQVNNLLHLGNNYDLIGDSYKESVYYRHFFALMCKTLSLDEFMKHYNYLVPNIYTPEPGVMMELLRAIELNGAYELIPRIWSDMVMFDHTDRENLLNEILKIAVQANVPKESELNAQYLKIAWDIYTKIVEQSPTRTKRLSFTGSLLSNILNLCVKANDFEKASQVMRKFEMDQQNVVGVAHTIDLQSYIDLCIDRKEPSKAIAVIQYCVDNGFIEAGQLARHVYNSFTLSEVHIDKLTNMVGKDVLKYSGEETTPEVGSIDTSKNVDKNEKSL